MESVQAVMLNPKVVISIITFLGTASVAYWKFRGGMQVLELKIVNRLDNIEKGMTEVKKSVKVLEEKQDLMEQIDRLKKDRRAQFEDALTQAIKYYPCEGLKRFAIQYVEMFAESTLHNLSRMTPEKIDEIDMATDIKRQALFDVAEECIDRTYAGAFCIWSNEESYTYKAHVKSIVLDAANDKANRIFIASLKHVHDVLSYILKLFYELEVSHAKERVS